METDRTKTADIQISGVNAFPVVLDAYVLVNVLSYSFRYLTSEQQWISPASFSGIFDLYVWVERSLEMPVSSMASSFETSTVKLI